MAWPRGRVEVGWALLFLVASGCIQGPPGPEFPPGNGPGAGSGPPEVSASPSNESSFEEAAWTQRIQRAFEPAECPPPRPHNASRYTGPLIDTHFHVQSLPDSTPQPGEPDEYGDPSTRTALMGVDVTINQIVCTFTYEGTRRALAFFAVYPDITPHALEVARRAVDEHQQEFIPFIMPPDSDDRSDGSPTVNATVLRGMLSRHPGLFRGYGEIGLYARPGGSRELRPDDPRLLEIYPVLRDHGLVAYFHLGVGHKESYERVLSAHPEIVFIFHGDQLSLGDVEDVLSNHSNARYGVDELYGDVWLLRREVTKQAFLAHFQDYGPLLEKDVATWKGFIERHPDQVMWGTDRGVTPWTVDLEVGWTLNDYGRAFIARLDPAAQAPFAHRNAERLFGST